MSQELTRKDFIRLSIAFVAVASGVAACSDDKSGSSGTSGSSSGDLDSGTSSGDIDSGTSSGGNDSGTSGGNDAASDTGTSSGGNDAGKDANGNSCGTNVTIDNANGGISSGHTHTLTIPAADFLGTADKTYPNIGGAHTHSLKITAANWATLRAGGTVNVTSGNEAGHDHACTIKCA